MIFKVMFSGVIMHVLSDFDTQKPLEYVFFEILGILWPNLAKKNLFGVTHFLTMQIGV